MWQWQVSLTYQRLIGMLRCHMLLIPATLTHFWKQPETNSSSSMSIVQPLQLGESPNVLDLILTNEEGMVSDLEHLPGLGNSDHVVLQTSLVC